MDNGMRIQDLKDVAPWGRSFSEYVRIFDLGPTDLARRILDCGGGPASFAAEAAERGYSVVACDPIYRFSVAEIEARVKEVYPVMVDGMRAERHRFVWTYTGSPEEVADRRLRAMRGFLDDLPSGLALGRYVASGLPDLPFPDDSFDLALSSHFLFLYSDQLSTAFHLAAATEMMRVAKEARIYPLMALNGSSSWHVDAVRSFLRAAGHEVELVAIDFEFQKGANQLMRIRRGLSQEQ